MIDSNSTSIRANTQSISNFNGNYLQTNKNACIRSHVNCSIFGGSAHWCLMDYPQRYSESNKHGINIIKYKNTFCSIIINTFATTAVIKNTY